MNYFSVFDFNKLDVLYNLSSIKECMDGIRQFASMADNYNPDMTNDVVCDIWGFCVFMHKEKITEPARVSRKEIEDKYDISIIYDYDKVIKTETERTRKIKNAMTAKELFNKVKNEIYLGNKGRTKIVKHKTTTIINSGQTLYGDIIDWLRDYYPNERPIWDETAMLLIGDYVIINSIL